MKDFLFSLGFSFACFSSAGVVAYGVSYPLNDALNATSQIICANSKDRALMHYEDAFFVNQTRIACVERKYL